MTNNYYDRHSGTIFSANTDWLNNPEYLVPKPVNRFWRMFGILAMLAIAGGILAGLAV